MDLLQDGDLSPVYCQEIEKEDGKSEYPSQLQEVAEANE